MQISMTNNWILRKEDKVFEPVSLKTLRTWVYENRVQGRDMVSSDGGKTWSLAASTPELMPFFSSQTPAVSESPTGYVGKIERRRRSIEVIDMIPMIDMVFLLLIFFALTNTFEVQRFMELNLPKGSSGIELKKTERLTLAINNENQIMLENEPIEPAQLAAKLKEIVQKDTEVTLVIQGDENVPHGRVVELMDAANGAGVKKILITVRKK
jgi:biopolymer transport protein ExbD